MKEKVEKLLSNVKTFEGLVEVFEGIPVEVRDYVMDYMEEKYPNEFDKWLDEE